MYDELVKELRDSAEWADRLALIMGRAEGDVHAPSMRKAADAIEELQKRVPKAPHGRLIDKDVICNECRRIAEEYDGIYPDCTYCPVHLAPTIIPEEPTKDGK